MVFGGKLRLRRCNSKASYLPRQSLEKLNNTDPVHGSYKLTLTSTEDLVGQHAKPPYDILRMSSTMSSTSTSTAATTSSTSTSASVSSLASTPPPPHRDHNNKIMNNLPDVLPLNAKLQTPTKLAGVLEDVPLTTAPLRYGSNNNLAINNLQQQQQQQPHVTSSTCYSITSSSLSQQRNSVPAMTLMSSFNAKSIPKYARSQSYDLNNLNSPANGIVASNAAPAAAVEIYTTHSSVDLRHEPHTTTAADNAVQLISPKATKEQTSNCETVLQAANDQASQPTEGRIFRAELVNTTASNPNKAMYRQDSLRDNIEKITQLQSKLMSAHLCDSSAYNVIAANPETEAAKAESEVAVAEVPEELAVVPEPVETPAATIDQQSDIDSLKMMQRSEIILRVNPTMVETASQTDDLTAVDMGSLTLNQHHSPKEYQSTRTTLQPRQPHPIEIEFDNLVVELLGLLGNSSSTKFINIIKPKIYKKSSEYVCNLYNPDVPLRPTKRDVGTSTLMRITSRDTQNALDSSLVALELQFAELDLIANSVGNEAADKLQANTIKEKLNTLVQQLQQKIKILSKEHKTVQEECGVNDELGTSLLEKLSKKVRPIEASKFRSYIDDVGHITSLLLSLSERLAQTEFALKAQTGVISGNGNAFENTNLETKRSHLFEQLEEAKRLKTDIDRRGNSIAKLFEKNLSTDDCADYEYFINMKAKLIADSRDIADKIKSSEEQLSTIMETMVQSDC